MDIITSREQLEWGLKTAREKVQRLEKDLSVAREENKRLEKDLMDYNDSIRNQFAMAALTGMISSGELSAGNQIDHAVRAYAYADAIMRERRVLKKDETCRGCKDWFDTDGCVYCRKEQRKETGRGFIGFCEQLLRKGWPEKRTWCPKRKEGE